MTARNSDTEGTASDRKQTEESRQRTSIYLSIYSVPVFLLLCSTLHKKERRDDDLYMGEDRKDSSMERREPDTTELVFDKANAM